MFLERPQVIDLAGHVIKAKYVLRRATMRDCPASIPSMLPCSTSAIAL